MIAAVDAHKSTEMVSLRVPQQRQEEENREGLRMNDERFMQAVP